MTDEGIVKLIDRHTERTWRAVEENRRKTGICRKTVYGELCIPPIKEKKKQNRGVTEAYIIVNVAQYVMRKEMSISLNY